MMNSIINGAPTLQVLLILLLAAALMGVGTAFTFKLGSRQSGSFFLTLTLLPMIICVVIMLVNGNIGAGVAVAGAFTLVRFRSVAGTGREIAAIFTCMAIGLALGMGYVGVAAVLFISVAVMVLLLYFAQHAGHEAVHKQMKITIPEHMDYNTLFDDVFAAHGIKARLIRIKSTAMGTLFDLTYDLTLPNGIVSKSLMDDLRARNGNLTIVIGPIAEENSL